MSKKFIIDPILRISDSVVECGHSFFTRRKTNQRIDFEKDNTVYFLRKGTVSLHRMGDGMLSMVAEAPDIVGLININFRSLPVYFLRCNSDCEMWAIGYDDFINLMDTKSQWSDCFKIISFHMSSYIKRELISNKRNSKELVFEHLKVIWELPEAERLNTSLFTYILSRNHISRSSINKVIHEFENENLISTCRGKLMYMRIES